MANGALTATEEAMPDAPKLIVSVKAFLENVPPGNLVECKTAVFQIETRSHSIPAYAIKPADLELHCSTCGGLRSFEEFKRNAFPTDKVLQSVTLRYSCRNCRRNEKIYSLLVGYQERGGVCRLYKLGEFPPFVPPTPPKVISLIREERDYYVKGRRAENQGMGIAAFAYYRRVVENEKDKILKEILKASRKVGASETIIAELEIALQETQFSTAIGVIRPAVPQALLIGGHNPLTLLHNALSEGLHAQTDDECLQLAKSIRIVLTELVERMDSVLKDDAELKTAVSKLVDVKAKKTSN
jgi:ribosomal protein L44E